MISREDFKLMAVGKYTFGKPSVKSEDYLTYLDGALFAFDKLSKTNELKTKGNNHEENDKSTAGEIIVPNC